MNSFPCPECDARLDTRKNALRLAGIGWFVLSNGELLRR